MGDTMRAFGTRRALPAAVLTLGVALTAACTSPSPSADAGSADAGSVVQPAVVPTTAVPEPEVSTTGQPSRSPSAVPTPTAGRTATASPRPTRGPERTASPTPSPSRSATPTPTASPTPSPTPTAGPAVLSKGDTGDPVRELQARLARAGVFAGTVAGTYGPVTEASVARYQRRHDLPVTGAVDQRTLDVLRSRTRKPTKLEMFPELAPQTPDAPAGSTSSLDPRCLTGRALCADKTRNRLSWVVDGRVRMTLTVRFGRASLPTSDGQFSVYWKDADHRSSTYDDAPMPYAMFFNGGQAVHFSPDFVALGYGGPGGSHGCINTRSKAKTAQLFDEVRVGDKVVVYRS